MEQSLPNMMAGVWRVIFLRGSPERVHYSRRRFLVGLFVAILLSGCVQWFVHEDHVTFVVLRVFAELTMFMLAVTLLTAKVARFRLAYAMLLLVLISACADAAMLLFAALPPGQILSGTSIVLGLAASFGAANTFAWALRKPISQGIVVVGVYLAAVWGLNLAFRALYDIAAFG